MVRIAGFSELNSRLERRGGASLQGFPERRLVVWRKWLGSKRKRSISAQI
jgi:hypothetical protein